MHRSTRHATRRHTVPICGGTPPEGGASLAQPTDDSLARDASELKRNTAWSRKPRVLGVKLHRLQALILVGTESRSLSVYGRLRLDRWPKASLRASLRTTPVLVHASMSRAKFDIASAHKAPCF